MFVYYDSNGKILCCIQGTSEQTPPDNPGTPLYLDDTQYADVYNNQAEYTIQNKKPVYTPIPDGNQLASAKQARLTYLGNAFNQAILSGFPSSADGTSRTYAIDPTAMGKWTGTLANINSGMLTANIQVKDISGNKVTLTPTQFKQFSMDGFTYFNNQEQNFWTKEDDASAIQLANYSTLQDAINAVNAVVY